MPQHSFLIGILFSLSACSPPAELEIVSFTDLGPLETTDAVKGRDGGYSVSFGDKSVWFYGDSILSLEGEDGSSWRHNTWSWTEDDDASDGLTGFSEPTDANGAPEEFFPQTAEEAEFNALHDINNCQEEPCGARRILWPMDAVEDKENNRVIVWYEKIYGEPGEWNFYGLGTGFAIWEDFDSEPIRPEFHPDSDEPTLLFEGDGHGFGSTSILEGDYLYGFGCEKVNLSKPCWLSRAHLDDILNPDAWRFWDGKAWSEDVSDSKELFNGASQMTIHYNEYLERYLAVHAVEGFDKIAMHTAPELTGPWSRKEIAFETESAEDGWVYCGVGHSEYAREDGRFEYVTYYRSTGDWKGELRLVEVELSGVD